MKPHSFRYFVPDTLDEALDMLSEYGETAKVMAGGQSLMPLLNYRMAMPDQIIDINRLPELDTPTREADGWRIPALVRQRTVERSGALGTSFPALRAAVRQIAHPQIRNRGTVCGSLAHADPAAELPAVMSALDAQMHLISRRGERVVPAAEFFLFHLTTALAEDELLLGVTVRDLPEGTTTGFEEFAVRRGDFALAAVVGSVTQGPDGLITQCRLTAAGVGSTPVRLAATEEALAGRSLDAAAIAGAEAAARAEVDPIGDVHASGAYRRHLVAALVRRMLNGMNSKES